MQTLRLHRSVNFAAPLHSPRSRRSFTMKVRACLHLDELHLSATRLEDRIVFTLLERTMYAYNRSLYNMHGTLDFETEGGMLRNIVSKLEHLQAAFGGFHVPEELPFFPQNLPEEWCATDHPDAAIMRENPLFLDPVAATLNCNSKLWTLYSLAILSQ
ncbi:hypothetical protein QN277_022388 [Acacia crassicarpa]|uniref:chorismate mutase n=1 Tax=Acacia crassicarpa TaxID=499986 RepID=A0AAE1MLT8_9FABA|nr:hypothetical protein QN277_022388 [Acacia crassicarpa]